MVRTGLGGSIPGAPDDSDETDEQRSSSSGGNDSDPADEFGQELGGDPAESGGSNTGTPEPDPAPAPEPSPDPADEFGPELGGDPAESGGSNTGAPEPEPDPADEFGQELGGDPAESGGSNTGAPEPDTGGGNRSTSGSSESVLDRALETSTGDATRSPAASALGRVGDVLFGTDSRDRGAAGWVRDRLDVYAERFDQRVADPLREDSRDRPPRSPAPGVGGLSDAANSPFVRDSAARTAELLNPARVGSDLLGFASASAQYGDFLVDEEGSLGTTADAVGDAAAAAPGAAVDTAEYVVENPRDAAVTGTALFATLGAGAAAGAASRGAARGAGRFVSRLDTPGGRPRGSGALDDFMGDRRAQTGQFRRRGRQTDENGRDNLVSGDDIAERDDQTAEIARQQYEQSRFEVEKRFGEEKFDRVPERPTRDGPGEINDIDSGIAGRGDPETFGLPGETLGERTRRLNRQKERAPNVPDDDLRDVVPSAPSTPRRARFSSTGAGATAAGVGAISGVNDPTGIATTFGTAGPGGTTVAPADDPTSLATSGGASSLGRLDPANDPTAIDPTGDVRVGEQEDTGVTVGAGEGSGTGTDVLDETNDPTDVAPPQTDTQPGNDTDTGVGVVPGIDTGTDQPPASDTDQPPATDTDQPPVTDTPAPPVTDTPVPPVVDTPPVTDTPPTPTPQPPTRPPSFPPFRPPPRRRPPRTPEPERERDRQRQRDREGDAEFRLFETVDDGGPAVGFGAETFAALATGPFEERQVAEGSTDDFYAGELPAAGFLDPDDDEEEGVEFVSGLFGLDLGFGGGGQGDT